MAATDAELQKMLQKIEDDTRLKWVQYFCSIYHFMYVYNYFCPGTRPEMLSLCFFRAHHDRRESAARGCEMCEIVLMVKKG